MEAIQRLLQIENGELQRLTRASFCGFLASLETALVLLPDDHAAEVVRHALVELRSLLDSSGASSPTGAPGKTKAPHTAIAPASTERVSWATLAEKWQKSPEWQSVLGNTRTESLASIGARELWLFTLRLPSSLAEIWQKEWYATQGATPTHLTTETWAGPHQHVLVPASEGSPVEVKLTLNARLPEILTGQTLGRFAQAMALPVAACLAWIEHDRSLRHMLRSLFRFGTVALADGYQKRFQTALTERFEQLREAEVESDAGQVVTAWVALDEAIHSLLHMPLAHPQSAFSEIGKSSRTQVGAVRDFAYSAGTEVHMQVLAGRYADLRGYTEPDADIEASEGAAPGDVALCTRLFLRLNGKSYPGRVVYRPR